MHIYFIEFLSSPLCPFGAGYDQLNPNLGGLNLACHLFGGKKGGGPGPSANQNGELSERIWGSGRLVAGEG